MTDRVEFQDHESGSAAFATASRRADRLALGFGVEADGDLDLLLDPTDAQALSELIGHAVAGADPQDFLTWHLDRNSVVMLRDALAAHAQRGGDVGGLLEMCDEWLASGPSAP